MQGDEKLKKVLTTAYCVVSKYRTIEELHGTLNDDNKYHFALDDIGNAVAVIIHSTMHDKKEWEFCISDGYFCREAGIDVKFLGDFARWVIEYESKAEKSLTFKTIKKFLLKSIEENLKIIERFPGKIY